MKTEAIKLTPEQKSALPEWTASGYELRRWEDVCENVDNPEHGENGQPVIIRPGWSADDGDICNHFWYVSSGCDAAKTLVLAEDHHGQRGTVNVAAWRHGVVWSDEHEAWVAIKISHRIYSVKIPASGAQPQ